MKRKFQSCRNVERKFFPAEQRPAFLLAQKTEHFFGAQKKKKKKDNAKCVYAYVQDKTSSFLDLFEDIYFTKKKKRTEKTKKSDVQFTEKSVFY